MAEEVLSLIPQTPEPLAQHYGVMHSAVMETARGRWFLHEYARRNRNADTTALLAAIDRIQAALNIKTAIPAASHDASRAQNQRASQEPAAPPSAAVPPQGMAAPFTHQLYELRDAILLTKDSLPAVGPNGRILSRNPDFHRIAKGIGIVAARMRWIAEQVPDAQNRSIVNAYEELDKLVEGANMVAALLAEVESRIGGMIEALESPAAEPAPDAAADETGESGLPNPEPRIVHHAAPQAAEPEPVDPEWLDRLAPPLRQYYPPSGLPIDPLNFEFHDPQPAPMAMPNPAWREAPLPPRPAPAASPPPAAPPVTPPPVNPRTAATPPIRPRRGAPAATPPVFHSRRAPVAPPVYVSRPAAPCAPPQPPVAAAPAPTPPAAAPQVPSFPPFASPAVAHVPVPNVFAAYSVTLRAVLPQSLQPPAAQAAAPAPPPTPAVEIPYTVADPAPALPAEEPARPAAAAKPRDPLAAIAALSDEEKIALFS
jgi:hypothetical protein